jgi:predicted RNA-binding Zn-ribbon protein involved in translation (DUF1610 family)
MYEGYKVHGPYTNREGRRMVSLTLDKKVETTAYARYLMECHLGYKLPKGIDVHHIDGDKLNDVIENLELKNHSEHCSEHTKEMYPEIEEKFICPTCGKEIILNRSRLHDNRHNRKMGKIGPFCNRSCAGKYSRTFQGKRDIHRERMRINNTSGYRGVSKRGNLWRAEICIDRKKKTLGYFKTPEEAYVAYCEAIPKMGD